jgi:hypothetical protein
MSPREKVENAVRVVLDQHREEVKRHELDVLFDRIEEQRGGWLVPVHVGSVNGPASDLNDLLRVMRRSIESRVDKPVSVLIDMDDTIE